MSNLNARSRDPLSQGASLFSGYLSGNFTYESQAGWNITIPAMAAAAIVKSGRLNAMIADTNRIFTKLKRNKEENGE